DELGGHDRRALGRARRRDRGCPGARTGRGHTRAPPGVARRAGSRRAPSRGRLHAGAFLRIASARWSVMRSAGLVAPTEAAVRSLHRRMRRSLFRDPIELADLAINGDDLRRAGIPAGPIYAKILHALLEL